MRLYPVAVRRRPQRGGRGGNMARCGGERRAGGGGGHTLIEMHGLRPEL